MCSLETISYFGSLTVRLDFSSWGIIFLYWELCFLFLVHRNVSFGHILRHKIQSLLQDAIWKGHQLLKVYVFR